MLKKSVLFHPGFRMAGGCVGGPGSGPGVGDCVSNISKLFKRSKVPWFFSVHKGSVGVKKIFGEKEIGAPPFTRLRVRSIDI